MFITSHRCSAFELHTLAYQQLQSGKAAEINLNQDNAYRQRKQRMPFIEKLSAIVCCAFQFFAFHTLMVKVKLLSPYLIFFILATYLFFRSKWKGILKEKRQSEIRSGEGSDLSRYKRELLKTHSKYRRDVEQSRERHFFLWPNSH